MKAGPLVGTRIVYADPGHVVWGEIAPRDGNPGFLPGEFREPYMMDVAFLRLLFRMRQDAQVPFRIVSDHRPPERNAAVGGASLSAHTEVPCRAVDLRIHNNFERAQILITAIKAGFVRFGIYPATAGQIKVWGPNSGSLHLDASTELPSPRVWMRF